MGPLLLNLRQRITLLERRITRAARGGVPYGVAMPFFGQPADIPRRYVQPMGQAVSRTTYRRIFEVVGTTYGAGNGSTTFVLPDLRGRTLVGLNAGDSDFGSVGQKVGAKTHTLTSAQIPNLTASSAGAHTHAPPAGTLFIGGKNGGLARRNAPTGTGQFVFGSPTLDDLTYPSVQSAGAHTHTVNSGGGGAHNNIQPSIACPWIMRY